MSETLEPNLAFSRIVRTLPEIAAHRGRGASYPDALPSDSVCDFDSVKDAVCANRAGGLSSVDTVLSGNDNRLYFIEFKDVGKNPISQLKKKAFDSQVILWLSFARHLSIGEIRRRSVFVYVHSRRDARLPSESFGEDILFKDANSLAYPRDRTGMPLRQWLNELRQSGLYEEVRACDTDGFLRLYSEQGFASHSLSDLACGADPTADLKQSVNRQEWKRIRLSAAFSRRHSRLSFGHGGLSDETCVVDFKALTEKELRKRAYLAGEVSAGMRPEGVLVCDAFMPESCQLLYCVACNDRFPVAQVVNKAFDGFWLWACACRSEESFDQLNSILSLVLVADGHDWTFVRHQTQCWLQNFYDRYQQCLAGRNPDREGRFLGDFLRVFVSMSWYKNSEVLSPDALIAALNDLQGKEQI